MTAHIQFKKLKRRMYRLALPAMRWLYSHTEQRVWDRPLDPIDPTTVGRFKIGAAAESALRLGLEVPYSILKTIVEGQEPAWIREFKSALRSIPVNPQYQHHMDQLIECCLVRRCQRGEIKMISGYFAVAKGEQARAIFNGSALSKLCSSPPNVNLTTHHRIVQEIANGRHYVCTVDLRHWFHQIKVSPATRALFGLALSEQAFIQWMCLPMGWSHSPAIAQAASWMLVLHRDMRDEELFNTDELKRPGVSLPAWMFSGSTATAVTIYYDNIIVLSKDKNEMQKIIRRIRANMEFFNAELKLSKLKDQGKASPTDPREVKLAIDDEWRYTDLRTGTAHNILGMSVTWNKSNATIVVVPRKLEEWKDQHVPSPLSLRKAAEFCGKLVFAAQLQSASLHATEFGRQVVRLASRVGIAAQAGAGWETEHVSSEIGDGLRVLWESLEALCRQPVRIEEYHRQQEADWVVATDASLGGWGLVVYRCCMHRTRGFKLEQRVHESGGRFRNEDTRHIFYKELEVALKGVEWMATNAPGQRFVMAIDNTAVVWAMRHGASRSRSAMVMIEKSSLSSAALTEVIAVASADNPADPASRGAPYEMKRELQMITAIQLHLQGLMWASERKEHSGHGGIRHEEPANDEPTWPRDVSRKKRGREGEKEKAYVEDDDYLDMV